MQWPDPVRQYVQRSFYEENAVAGVSRDEMTDRLKKIINKIAETGLLDATDWPNMPLPQAFILEERESERKRIAAAVALPTAQQFAYPGPTVFQHPSPASRDSTVFTDTLTPKKRKSSDMDLEGRSSRKVPPWEQKQQPISIADRVSLPQNSQQSKKDKKRKFGNGGIDRPEIREHEREKRAQRFGASLLNEPSSKQRPLFDEALQGPVVGTSQELEKRYFRLNGAPKPETVRPEPVLRKTLQFLKKKWIDEKNYNYICDQFKSLRQDLTVQRIRNSFTVDAYECHARIALEKGDLGEYNQCQTQLRALYRQNLGGNPAEFLAYRILYFIYTSHRPDMNSLLASLTPAQCNEPEVRHALKVRSAIALGNYHRFFQLYLDAPGMGDHLMAMFLARERLAALAKLCRSYKPTVDLSFVATELAFEREEECAQFLCEVGATESLERKDNVVIFATAKARGLLENAKAQAFRSVDIKGQI